jgi:hypothetical protein
MRAPLSSSLLGVVRTARVTQGADRANPPVGNGCFPDPRSASYGDCERRQGGVDFGAGAGRRVR